MGKTLYLECSSGISGDMSVAALLDLGADQEVLQKALASLPVHGYEIEITRVSKSGLDACDFNVKLDQAHENHDHDMEYLHGHGHEHHEHDHDHNHSHEHMHDHDHNHSHEHMHDHDHNHSHEHMHDHDHSYNHSHGHHHTHSHEHRGLHEIYHIIDHADLTYRAAYMARKIFMILAQAEAKAHGLPMDQVHFHEVGAVDSIVDVVAFAVCLDNLDITEVIVPHLNEGTGFVRCQHGVIPVPVPAVLNIVSANGITLHITDVQGELVTPTGAAIVAAIKTSDHLPETFTINRIGLGAGKRKYERPSLVRAMLITPKTEEKDWIWRLESNIDDCSGEALGYVMERLLDAGARDVNYTPVFMKKNRPAYQLNVICDEASIARMEQIIFAETTTIGIRKMKMERTVLKRSAKEVETPYGTLKVKECTLPDGSIRRYPEYESAASVARKTGLPLQEIYRCIEKEC